jgi:hypothetical protein
VVRANREHSIHKDKTHKTQGLVGIRNVVKLDSIMGVGCIKKAIDTKGIVEMGVEK